ncbi:MAG: hypothetical protein ACXAAH_01230 [Promethearchaeota archaeon]|jgi:hypothetical protein
MGRNKEIWGYWKIDWGRQGRVILAYILVFIGYYGIIVNFFMLDQGNNWFSFEDIPEAVKSMIFWTYEYILPSFMLPWLLLFFICLWLTYKEDIAHYGIRASLWLVPFIVFEGFILYLIMFGFSFEPLGIQFASIKGYINLLILFTINLCGALSGKYLKRYVKSHREI